MTIKSSQTLVSEALSKVKTITADEALKLSNEDKCTLIDIREKGELDKTGRIENSNHIPRGMLEFWLDPEGPYFKSGKIDMNKEIVSYIRKNAESPIFRDSIIKHRKILLLGKKYFYMDNKSYDIPPILYDFIKK